jgi:hypothetical protein
LSTEPTPFDILKKRLDEAVQICQQPEERRIGYGNLRHEYCEWCRGSQNDTNIAVIYEVPGGSTTQINITYNHETGEFSYLDADLEDSVVTRDPDQVFDFIENHVRTIPAKRLQQIENTVAEWISQGKGRSEIFAELNKLLQTEFLGGRVTNKELKHGIQYLVKEHARMGA